MRKLVFLLFVGFASLPACDEDKKPPPPLNATVSLDDYIGYICTNGSPVDGAYSAIGELEIQITGKSKPKFNEDYSFYGSNPALDPSGNCVDVEIPKNDPYSATAVYLEKGNGSCQANSQEGRCIKWIAAESFPATRSAPTGCPSQVNLYVNMMDPDGWDVPCNL